MDAVNHGHHKREHTMALEITTNCFHMGSRCSLAGLRCTPQVSLAPCSLSSAFYLTSCADLQVCFGVCYFFPTLEPLHTLVQALCSHHVPVLPPQTLFNISATVQVPSLGDSFSDSVSGSGELLQVLLLPSLFLSNTEKSLSSSIHWVNIYLMSYCNVINYQ